MFDELSLNILDIGMNAVAAGATMLELSVIESQRRDWLILRVRDNGRGMDAATLRRVLDHHASSKTGRKKAIGLGLALLRQTAEMCGGTFDVRSVPGRGTSVTASMRLRHIDRPPLGDLQATVLALSAQPTLDVRLCYRTDNATFHFSSKEGTHDEPRRTQETPRPGATTSCAA